MKFATDRPCSNPEKAARKLIEIANSVESFQDGRIYIERINGPFLYEFKGSPAEYKAGLLLSIERGWPWLHESGKSPTKTPVFAQLCPAAWHFATAFGLP
jgi:hypothetical protein